MKKARADRTKPRFAEPNPGIAAGLAFGCLVHICGAIIFLPADGFHFLLGVFQVVYMVPALIVISAKKCSAKFIQGFLITAVLLFFANILVLGFLLVPAL